jgi:hypothetical protein
MTTAERAKARELVYIDYYVHDIDPPSSANIKAAYGEDVYNISPHGATIMVQASNEQKLSGAPMRVRKFIPMHRILSLSAHTLDDIFRYVDGRPNPDVEF